MRFTTETEFRKKEMKKLLSTKDTKGHEGIQKGEFFFVSLRVLRGPNAFLYVFRAFVALAAQSNQRRTPKAPAEHGDLAGVHRRVQGHERDDFADRVATGHWLFKRLVVLLRRGLFHRGDQ